ncbi:MAG: Panacea domain-containing protein [Kiloniellaceae bacterium]
MATQSTVYDSVEIADHFIEKAGERGLDSLQVMKLTYIAHGFVLGFTGEPLLKDDVEAWKYGPVVRRVYGYLPRGYQPIKRPFTETRANIHADILPIIDGVFEKYGTHSGLYLSSLTHRPGSPWQKTWDTYGQNAVIPQSLIEAHYRGILAKSKAAAAEGKSYHPDAL